MVAYQFPQAVHIQNAQMLVLHGNQALRLKM
jgi:hypothetical protein